MKPLHKSILLWSSIAAGVLAAVQQQAAPLAPAAMHAIGIALAVVTATRVWLDAARIAGRSPAAELATSVPLWCQAALAVTTHALEAGWIDGQAAATLTTVATVLPIIHRGNLALYSDPPPPPPPYQGPTMLTIAIVYALGIAKIAAFVIVTLSLGCVRWPDVCQRQAGEIRCTCSAGKIDVDNAAARPAVTMTCDGKRLPIVWTSAQPVKVSR